MGELTHLKQDPRVCILESPQDLVAVFTPWGRRTLPVLGGIDIRLAHWLPGKLAEGYGPHHLFGKLSWWRRSDPKIRANTSWSRSQVCRELCKVSLGEAGPGGAGEVWAREQPSWVAWWYTPPLYNLCNPLQFWSAPVPQYPWGQVYRKALQSDTTNTIQITTAKKHDK